MNYNSKNKVYSKRLSPEQEKILSRKAKAYRNPITDMPEPKTNSQYLSMKIDEELAGKLISIKEDLQMQKLKKQITKLDLENQYLEIRIGHTSRPKATITMKKSLYVENNSDTNSVRSPYDAELKRLQCIDCFAIFSWSSKEDWIDQLGEYQKHLVSMHNREMNTLEKDVILKLQYEGESL